MQETKITRITGIAADYFHCIDMLIYETENMIGVECDCSWEHCAEDSEDGNEEVVWAAANHLVSHAQQEGRVAC